jgi:hypothetical protein
MANDSLKWPYHSLEAQNPLPLMATGVLFELRAAEMSFWYLISVQIAITTRFGNKFETLKKILKLLQGNYSEPFETASDGYRW